MSLIKVPPPHLTTAYQGPLFRLEEVILKNVPLIEEWFKKSFEKTPPPINSSVDLRHARYKIAPVDTNLFPGGFNNLNLAFMPMCIQAAQSILNAKGTKILLIPENNTRNKFYMQSLVVLRDILMQAGFIVRLGNLAATAQESVELKTEKGEVLLFEPLVRTDNRIGLKNFDPCLVLLNNDLSTGIPDILRNIEQRIEPSLELGWSSRLKSHHFAIYDVVVDEFTKLFDLDPWLINSFFTTHVEVDFMLKVGIESLAHEVDKLIMNITEKYDQYNISDKPFVVIKADNGTYGMSVMMVSSGNELLAINRKTRTHMSTTKGQQKVHRVMLQEGVYSFETISEQVAEPVIYMLGQYVVGGFYRVHKNKGVGDNLNSPGMHFEPLAFASGNNRFYVYGVIARLAALAAAREIALLQK